MNTVLKSWREDFSSVHPFEQQLSVKELKQALDSTRKVLLLTENRPSIEQFDQYLQDQHSRRSIQTFSHQKVSQMTSLQDEFVGPNTQDSDSHLGKCMCQRGGSRDLLGHRAVRQPNTSIPEPSRKLDSHHCEEMACESLASLQQTINQNMILMGVLQQQLEEGLTKRLLLGRSQP